MFYITFFFSRFYLYSRYDSTYNGSIKINQKTKEVQLEVSRNSSTVANLT